MPVMRLGIGRTRGIKAGRHHIDHMARLVRPSAALLNLARPAGD